MRMTNKIMRNNSAYNINQNKILQDKLTNQMTNQSKIVRPSDDPVVAIRALRLRSNVTAVTQYNDRNAKDADQWLALTADAMDTVDAVLEDLYKQAMTAPNKYQTADELRILLSQMKQMTAEFYSCANVDYAGRYIFSGYRTDLPVTFTEEDKKEMDVHPVSYNINETFGFQDVSRVSYTGYEKLSEKLNGNAAGTGPAAPSDITPTHSYEQSVKNDTLYRFRISYNDLDTLESGSEITITLPKMPEGEHIKITAAGSQIVDDDGNPIATPITAAPQVKEYKDQEEAYKDISEDTFKGIAYIPTSGELVFSKEFYDANFNEAAFQDTAANQGNAKALHINYNKSTWQNGDINPVHYFECTETLRTTGPDENPPKYRKTAYNIQREEGRNQDIYYDVGYNQQIQVNTRADEVFTHNVQRDMDDFEHYIKQLEDIETLQTDLENKRKDYSKDDPEYKDLTLRLEGAKKAWTYIRDDIQTKFENQMTKYQQYKDDAGVAMTDSATRRSRLELISTRLTNQKATFKELQQDNEGIDITEVAVELTASELTYNAALMATGKIMQTNLMNYI